MRLCLDSGPDVEWIRPLLARGWEIDGDAFTTRRPDQGAIGLRTPGGARVVAKRSPPERAARTFANMQALWASCFGAARSSPGLPRPLELLEDQGVLIMERVDGRPLAELGPCSPARSEAALRLLADLHGSDVAPAVHRSSRGIVRSMERKAARVAALDPTLAGPAGELASAIAAHRVKERVLRPSHGDFSGRNVIVSGSGAAERLVLIDWDRLQLADPARDVVYFGTQGWADWLRRGRWPDREPLRRALAFYDALRPEAEVRRSARFHVAAACLRRALSVLELWPDQAWLAPVWLRTGLRELEDTP